MSHFLYSDKWNVMKQIKSTATLVNVLILEGHVLAFSWRPGRQRVSTCLGLFCAWQVLLERFFFMPLGSEGRIGPETSVLLLQWDVTRNLSRMSVQICTWRISFSHHLSDTSCSCADDLIGTWILIDPLRRCSSHDRTLECFCPDDRHPAKTHKCYGEENRPSLSLCAAVFVWVHMCSFISVCVFSCAGRQTGQLLVFSKWAV